MDLPILTENIPSLNCYAEDFFLRLFKEKLGNFELDIQKSIFETKNSFKEMDRRLNEFIKKSKKNYIKFYILSYDNPF